MNTNTAITLPAAPRRWPLFLLCYLLIAYVFSAITPPFQAPDEFNHVERAYLLSQGYILLKSVNGAPSGGEVDQGLLDYMATFRPMAAHADRKISASELAAASEIRWSNSKSQFETPVNMAYYFPLLYLPSAMGMKLGRAFDLTVDHSYRLARLLTLCTCLVILFFAFRLYPPPIFVLVLLALPMNLFLFSAAVLDGMATSVAVLALSAFMRIVADKGKATDGVIRVLIVSIALVAAARANLLPLLLLPFAAYLLVRRRSTLVWAAVCSLFVLGWTFWTVKFTVFPPDPRNVDHLARLFSYVLHPWTFLGIVYATLTDPGIFTYYVYSFIGTLGWLDAPLPAAAYRLFEGLIALTLLSSVSWRALRIDWKWRSMVALCVLASVLLTFLALLVEWTVGPATRVDGVQGRYFIIPALMLAYALLSEAQPLASFGGLVRTGLAALVLAVTVHYSVPVLVGRYYAMAAQPEVADLSLKASQPLSKDRPIQIHFAPAQAENPVNLSSISLRFGTYMTSHPGKAVLRLWTTKHETATLPIKLSSLVDNAYQTFPLDNKAYVGGEIVAEDGEGVSTYETYNSRSGLITECMVLGTSDKGSILTPGCPQP